MEKTIWAERIFLPNGRLTKENILEGAKALDVGCGKNKLPGATGIDIIANSAGDIIHDIGVFPWPVASGTYDLVLMSHVLEHVENIHRTLDEVHRVLKPDGTLVIQVPYFRHVDAFTSPDHRHFFTSATLEYVFDARNRPLKYTGSFFGKRGFWYDWPTKKLSVIGRFKRFLQRRPWWYDQYFALLLPAQCVTWEMVKK